MEIDPLVKKLVELHYHSDLDALALKSFPEEVDVDFLINQIKGHRKAREKLPEWAKNNQIIYPPYLSMEQCSSQFTAQRKALFFDGTTVLDMTGGIGVDAYYISKKVDKYTLVEQQSNLASINQHNFKHLGQENIEIVVGNSIDLLKKELNYDIIYLDPARRKNTKSDKNSRAFFLEDFSPNVVSIYEKLFETSTKIIIKLAPMLDVQAVIEQLPDVKTTVAISYKNEVKELLVILSKKKEQRRRIAINLLDSSMREQYFESEEKPDVTCPNSKFKKYIYEPNKAILKLQLQNHVGMYYELEKLDAFTHFYTSDELIANYPGRIFEVEKELPMKQKAFSSVFLSDKAHVISRNHPLSSEQIRNRFKLIAAGNDYLIACTNIGKKKLIWTKLVPTFEA